MHDDSTCVWFANASGRIEPESNEGPIKGPSHPIICVLLPKELAASSGGAVGFLLVYGGDLSLCCGTHEIPMLRTRKRAMYVVIDPDQKLTSWRPSAGSPWCSTRWDPSTSKTASSIGSVPLGLHSCGPFACLFVFSLRSRGAY